MANEMVVVEKVTRGHLKSSSKVISNFDQVCVWYHWKGYLSGTLVSGKTRIQMGGGGAGGGDAHPFLCQIKFEKSPKLVKYA